MMRPLATPTRSTVPLPDAQQADGRDLRFATPLVRASLMRSRTAFSDPSTATVRSILDADALDDYRGRHRLSAVLPLIRSLLATPAQEHGLIMAVGDELGRLLWVEGDPGTRGKAEDMAFLPGADWSESSVGTSAPGIAIATGAAVQVRREEHFAPQVTAFSCSAVPLKDPASGDPIGFLDLTGGDRAVDSLILPYLRSTAEAVQAHLAAVATRPGHLPDADASPHPARRASRPSARQGAPGRASAAAHGSTPTARRRKPQLVVTGHQPPAIHTAEGITTVSRRHAEILAALARTEEGLDTAELAEAIYPTPVTPVTVRAELTRLRKALSNAGLDDQVELSSRPYRVTGLNVDAISVETLLGRGAHKQALAECRGALLPDSEAPVIVAWREELAATLRETVLSDASADTLMTYLRRSEAAQDAEAWALALKLLPPRSPKRAAVLARLEAMESADA